MNSIASTILPCTVSDRATEQLSPLKWHRPRMVGLLLAALLALLTAGSSLAFADEALIRKQFEARYPKAKLEAVRPLPYGGLYELVVAGGPILYVDGGFSFLLQGALVDLKTGANVTGDRQKELQVKREGPIDFSVLPLDLALKKTRGAGTRTLVTFEDPNCGFCQKLAPELAKLENVTIYTFLLPIVSPDSLALSRAIWCSEDRVLAWDAWMNRGQRPSGGSQCETPVDRTLALAERLGIEGTPTLFLANGQRIVGGMSAGQLDKLLDTVR